MSERITLDVPEPVAESARAVAQRTRRSLETVLLDWLDRVATDLPVELLPDDHLLALRDLQLSAAEQETLSDLLTRQREGLLTDAERTQLDDLLARYRRGQVRKAQALKVAVDRGLLPPLSAS